MRFDNDSDSDADSDSNTNSETDSDTLPFPQEVWLLSLCPIRVGDEPKYRPQISPSKTNIK